MLRCILSLNACRQRKSARLMEFQSNFAKFVRICSITMKFGNDRLAHKLQTHLKLNISKKAKICAVKVNKIAKLRTIWKKMFVGWECPQKFGEMLARCNIFYFNFFFTTFFHITFKHCRKNGWTNWEMMTIDRKSAIIYDQCLICNSRKWTSIN